MSSEKTENPVLVEDAGDEFDKFDTDGSGNISKGEAKEFLLDRLGLQAESGYIDELWKAFDEDNSGALEKAEWVKLRKHIQADADAKDAYVISGSARLPGSKYSIGEIEINDCETRKQLEKLVEEARETGHTGGGCCGFCKAESILDDWKFLGEDDVDWESLGPQYGTKAADGLGPQPAATHDVNEEADFSYNPNYFAPNDKKLTLLHFNRRKLIEDILEDDQPAFEMDDHSSAEVHTMAHPTDEDIDAMTDKELKFELRRRGFVKPPYKLWAHAEGDHLIGKDASSTHFKENAREEMEFFKGGLPALKNMTQEQKSKLLKEVAHDPRHKDGTPVVQPAFYQRECRDKLCIILFAVYWLLMIILMIIVVYSPFKGAPFKLIRPIDYQGDTCQDPASTSYTEKDPKYDRPSIVFPRLAEDALAIYQQVQANLASGGDDGSGNCATSAEGCFYGVCVKGCPEEGDIVCNYQTEVELRDSGNPSNNGYYSGALKTRSVKARANARAGCWYITLPLYEVSVNEMDANNVTINKQTEARYPIDHCGPVGDCYNYDLWDADPSKVPIDVKCASCAATGCDRKRIGPEYPRGCSQESVDNELLTCPGVVEQESVEVQRYNAGTQGLTKQFAGITGKLTRSAKDIWNARWMVFIGGVVLAALIGGAFISFMSLFAYIIVWTTLHALWFVIFCGLILTTAKAGTLDTVFAEGIDKSGMSPNSTATVKVKAGVDKFLKQANSAGKGVADQGQIDEDQEALLWMYASWANLGAFIIYPLILCILRKRINLAIELVKEAGRSIMRMKFVLIFPLWTYVGLLVSFIYFAIVTTYIFTTTLSEDAVRNAGAEFDNVDNLDELYDGVQSAQDVLEAASQNSTDDGSRITLQEVDSNEFVKVLFLFHFFGYLWISETIKGIGILTIAGAISTDYWVPNDSQFVPDLPVSAALGRSLRFHAGSAMFGGAILAAVRLARYIAMYIDSKTAELQKNNLLVKIIMKVVHCFLWCLEKCLRFLISSAYILIAIEGRGFCLSAWRGFKLLFSNSLRVATTVAISKIIITLGRIGIVASCTVITYLALTSLDVYGPDSDYGLWVDQPVLPTALTAVIAIFVTGCFMDVYDTSIQTLLLSFCLDEDKFKNGLYKDKLDIFGEPDPRMLAEINGKTGLMQMVNGASHADKKKTKAKKQGHKEKHNAAVESEKQPLTKQGGED